MDEQVLRSRFRRLNEMRPAPSAQSRVPLEVIEALAEDRLDGEERLEALDLILADPATRTEYLFLREISSARRPRAEGRTARGLMAAAILVMVGVGLLWRASSPAGPEPLRGPGPSVVLLAPGEGDTLVPGDRLVWRPVAGARGYVAEVLTLDGAVAFSAETLDTTAVLTVAQGVPFPPGPALWSVVAKLGGRAERRSAPRKIVLGR